MKKQVSRQSLAVVALSIVLALCMAMTATFAAFQASAKVTGTITFTEASLGIILEGTEWDTSKGTITFTNSNFTVSDNSGNGKVILNKAARATIVGLKCKVTGIPAGSQATISVSVTTPQAGCVALTAAGPRTVGSTNDAAPVFSKVDKGTGADANSVKSLTFQVKITATLK